MNEEHNNKNNNGTNNTLNKIAIRAKAHTNRK
jgi:hypothetical protein